MNSKIDIAKETAEKVHGSQTDKKNFPYMAHVNDVAKRVQQLGDDYFIVGLLHDAIEDAVKHNDGQRFQEEIKKLINTTFNQEIVDAINAMTKLPEDNYFEDYLPRVKGNNIAKEVKIADSSHNLSKAHLLGNEPELQEKLRNKYIKVLNELGADGPSCEKPIIFKDGEWIEK
tara:strand:- start:362 stop:880 length:519 start_codon:yes stop_codon:yes gene_type:complete